MQSFSFVTANSVLEAVTLLNSERKVRVLSGGTDLIVQLREGRKQADLLVDVKRIPELCAIQLDPQGWLTIGAAVSCARVCADERVRVLYPGLVDAISLIGGTQIQGRASVGGNLCNASPAADSAPALIVHNAVCVIAGAKGVRELPVRVFCAGPGQNALEAGELLVAIRVPPAAPGFGAAYTRFIPRNEMDIAVVGVGAGVRLEGERFAWARVALGAVAPTPLTVDEVGDFLSGKPVVPEVIQEAARIAQSAARPIDDMRGTAAHRKHLALILSRRALAEAVARARGGEEVVEND